MEPAQVEADMQLACQGLLGLPAAALQRVDLGEEAAGLLETAEKLLAGEDGYVAPGPREAPAVAAVVQGLR